MTDRLDYVEKIPNQVRTALTVGFSTACFVYAAAIFTDMTSWQVPGVVYIIVGIGLITYNVVLPTYFGDDEVDEDENEDEDKSTNP